MEERACVDRAYKRLTSSSRGKRVEERNLNKHHGGERRDSKNWKLDTNKKAARLFVLARRKKTPQKEISSTRAKRDDKPMGANSGARPKACISE